MLQQVAIIYTGTRTNAMDNRSDLAAFKEDILEAFSPRSLTTTSASTMSVAFIEERLRDLHADEIHAATQL